MPDPALSHVMQPSSKAAFWRVVPILLTLWLVVAHASVGGAQAGNQPVERLAGEPAISLAGHFSVLRDDSHALTLSDVAFGAAASGFRAEPHTVALGYTAAAAWVKLSIDNSSGNAAEALYLALLPVYLQRLDVFVPLVANPSSAADFSHFQRGSQFINTMAGEQPLFFTIPLSPVDAPVMTVYLRIETGGTLVLGGWLATLPGLQNILLVRSVVAVALITLTLSAAFISLIYWLLQRQRYFLKFAFLVLADCLYIVATSGLAIPLLAALPAAVHDIVVGQSVLILVLANVLFVQDQLETRRYFPRFDRTIELLVVFILMAMGASLLGWYRHLVGPVILVGVATVAAFIFFGWRLRAAHPKPGLMAALAAGMVKLIGGAIIASAVIGTDGAGFIDNAYWFAVAAFTPLMALSLVQRARFVDARRRDRDSLRVARRAESVARDLVEVRTAQLRAAKETAEAALASEQAARIEQLRFVDVVRHQYQTPLAVITTTVAALKQTMGAGDSAQHDRFARIRTAVNDLMHVLDVSLHRSRLQGSAAMAQRVPATVQSAIAAPLERTRSLYPARTISLEVDGSLKRMDTISVDPDMLAIALTNLVENALKFSSMDQAVAVVARFDEPNLVIEVCDRGIGVPGSDIAQLGQRYFRASNAGGLPGTGLGLHIVKQVAEAHEGSMTIVHRPGGGAVVRLALRAT